MHLCVGGIFTDLIEAPRGCERPRQGPTMLHSDVRLPARLVYAGLKASVQHGPSHEILHFSPSTFILGRQRSRRLPKGKSMDEVLPGLWIGDLACALSTEYLSLAGVTHIVTALAQRLPPPGRLPCGRTIPASHLVHIRCDDEESEPIIVHLPRANELISDVLAERWVEGEQGGEIDEPRPSDGKWGHWETTGEGTVLVHCQAGCSRSVALVAAYIMATRGLTRDEALDLIRARRHQAEPNPGFMEQLDLYERAGYQVDLRHAPIRRFLMSKTDVLNGGRVEDLLLSYYPSPAVSPSPSSTGSSRGSAWASLSPLEEGHAVDGAKPLSRRPSRSAPASNSSRIDLSKSPAMPDDTDDRFALDQAKLREEQSQRQKSTSAGNSESDPAPDSKINDWATSISSPHEVMVTRSLGSRQPFNVPATSLRGHESSSNRGSIPKPDRSAFASTIRLRCKMCRREIAARDHVVEHEVGKGKGAFELKKRSKDEKLARHSEGFSTRPRDGTAGAPSHSVPSGSSLDMDQKFGSYPRKQPSDDEEDGTGSSQEQGSMSTVDSQDTVKPDVRSSDSGMAALSLDSPQAVLLNGEQVDEVSAKAQNASQRNVAASGRPIQSAASLTASLPPHLAALRAGRAPPGAESAQQQALRDSQQRSESTQSGALASSSKQVDGRARGISDTTTPAPPPLQSPSSSTTTSTSDAPPLLPSARCTSYFLEPLSWMNLPSDGSTLQGRLLCPNSACKHKLGGWDWAGLQCACGAWVTPGFAVLASRVDEVQSSPSSTSTKDKSREGPNNRARSGQVALEMDR